MSQQTLDKKVKALKLLEEKIKLLTTAKEELRKEVIDMIASLHKNNILYKTPLATVAYVENKAVKIIDREKLLAFMQEKKIVKYLEHIPEHDELNKSFTEDVKKGLFTNELIEVTTTPTIAIRFHKEESKE